MFFNTHAIMACVLKLSSFSCFRQKNGPNSWQFPGKKEFAISSCTVCFRVVYDDTESKFYSSGRQWRKIRRQCGEPRSVRGRRSASGGAVLAPTVKPFKCRQTRKQGAQSRTQPQVLPPPTPEATTTPTTSPWAGNVNVETSFSILKILPCWILYITNWHFQEWNNIIFHQIFNFLALILVWGNKYSAFMWASSKFPHLSYNYWFINIYSSHWRSIIRSSDFWGFEIL